jgi:hypothetical protein
MLWNRNECGRNKVMRSSRQPSSVQTVIDQKQQENVEYVDYLSNVITGGVRCTCDIKFRIIMTKAALDRKIFTSKLRLRLRKKFVKCYTGSTACMALKLGHLRDFIRNVWGVWKSGAGKVGRRLVGLSM